MKPTQDQISAEVAALAELKPHVRRMTVFGDDNHAAIEIQIRVLSGELDEDGVQELLDAEDITEHEYDNAMEALNWLEGEGDSLSGEWEGLVQFVRF